MSRFHSYLNTAQYIIEHYKGDIPLSIFLKDFFSNSKKYGSTDRRSISSLCYNYYRVGKALKENLSIAEKILIAFFLLESKPSKFLEELKPEWNKHISQDINTKSLILENLFDKEKIFPFKNELSNGMDRELFSESFLLQPKLFLRIRPGYEKIVLLKLKDADIFFEQVSDHCMALNNGVKLDQIIEIDKEAVIQDYSSQKTSEVMKPILQQINGDINCWDCCAASGGKSMMLFDINKNIRLTVSDNRSSILKNLDKRFKNAGIKNYTSFITDLAINKNNINENFNLIIADVPCTGSGTWVRTPEQLYFFEADKIKKYAERQKKILSNVIPHLKNNGYLAYITCSVFKAENEDIIKFITQNYGLETVTQQLLTGYNKLADSMFISILKND